MPIVWIILVILLLGGYPWGSWHSYGYYPSGTILLIIIILLLFGYR